jgi:hypothetical protein
MPSSTSRPGWHDRARTAALWTGLLAGPLVWLALLQVNYVLSYVSCETRQNWFLHAATGVAIVLVSAAGYVAWRYGPPEDREELSPPVTRTTAEMRARWMATGGVALSLWFILVIVATEIPVLLLRPCQ